MLHVLIVELCSRAGRLTGAILNINY